MLTVVAHYTALPGTGDAIAEILSKHVPATRGEPGCVTFEAYRNRDDPDRFVLYEQYVDDEAFAAHRTTPHFKEYIEGGIVPRLQERTWSLLEAIEPA